MSGLFDGGLKGRLQARLPATPKSQSRVSCLDKLRQSGSMSELQRFDNGDDKLDDKERAVLMDFLRVMMH